jgi:hypothetical protein
MLRQASEHVDTVLRLKGPVEPISFNEAIKVSHLHTCMDPFFSGSECDQRRRLSCPGRREAPPDILSRADVA